MPSENTEDGRNSFPVPRDDPFGKLSGSGQKTRRGESVTCQAIFSGFKEHFHVLASVVFFFLQWKLVEKISKAITSHLKNLREEDYSHALNSNLLIYFTFKRRNSSMNSFPYFQKSLYIYTSSVSRTLSCTPNTNIVLKIVLKLFSYFKFVAHDLQPNISHFSTEVFN